MKKSINYIIFVFLLIGTINIYSQSYGETNNNDSQHKVVYENGHRIETWTDSDGKQHRIETWTDDEGHDHEIGDDGHHIETWTDASGEEHRIETWDDNNGHHHVIRDDGIHVETWDDGAGDVNVKWTDPDGTIHEHKKSDLSNPNGNLSYEEYSKLWDILFNDEKAEHLDEVVIKDWADFVDEFCRAHPEFCEDGEPADPDRLDDPVDTPEDIPEEPVEDEGTCSKTCDTKTHKLDVENCECVPLPKDDTCPEGQIKDGKGGCKPDPCANKDLRNKTVSDDVKNQINQRKQTVVNTNPPGVNIYNSFSIQTIENGVGDINLDNYSLDINQLPDGYTPQQLFEEIRTNFDNLVTGGGTWFDETSFRPYDTSVDAPLWNGDNPIGAGMNFHTFFDTATVVCTEYSQDEMYWTFSTVTSVDHYGHPVSGHRQFSLEDNGDGTYSFVIRGADRLHTSLDVAANATLGPIDLQNGGNFAFDLADRTWKNLMKSIEKLVKEKPGADVSPFDENKDDYAKRYDYNKDDCPE